MRDEDGVRRGELPKGQRRAAPLILSEVRVDEEAGIAAGEHQRRRAVPCDLHAVHKMIVTNGQRDVNYCTAKSIFRR